MKYGLPTLEILTERSLDVARRVLNAFWVLLLAGHCLPISAAPQKVYFAGFAYLSDCDNVADFFPYVHQAIGDGKCAIKVSADGRYVTRGFSEAALAAQNDTVEFSLALGDSQLGDAISMAVALDRENVTVTKIGERYSIAYDLSAQLLTFDFVQKKIIGAYPIALRYMDVAEQPPTEQQHVEAFGKMVVDQTFPANLINEFARVAQRISIKPVYGGYFKVRRVDLADKTLEYLKSQGQDAEDYSTWVAQMFSKSLSSKLNMPVLPYTKGQAIGGKMAARFADGEAFNLIIPAANYVADINIRGMLKKQLDQSSARVAYSYIVGLGLTVSQPLSRREYMSANFQLGRVRTISKSQGELNDWAEFEETLMLLADELALQTVARDRKWLKKHTPKKTDIKALINGLAAFEEKVIQRVR